MDQKHDLRQDLRDALHEQNIQYMLSECDNEEIDWISLLTIQRPSHTLHISIENYEPTNKDYLVEILRHLTKPLSGSFWDGTVEFQWNLLSLSTTRGEIWMLTNSQYRTEYLRVITGGNLEKLNKNRTTVVNFVVFFSESYHHIESDKLSNQYYN